MRRLFCTKNRDDLLISGNKKYSWCKHCYKLFRNGVAEIQYKLFVDAIFYEDESVRKTEDFIKLKKFNG